MKKIIPSSCKVDFIADNKRNDYTVLFNYDNMQLTGKFMSVHRCGYGISNSFCLN